MLEIVTPQSELKTGKIKVKGSSAHLELVVSNTRPGLGGGKDSPFFEDLPDSPSFFAQTTCQSEGSYTMNVQDASHSLACTLKLEVREGRNEHESATVTCHLPPIADHDLNYMLWDDETLYGIVMVRFQMKILEQLLLFCATHHALNLTVIVDTPQVDTLEIYNTFIVERQQSGSLQNRKTGLSFSAQLDVYDRWVDFMESTVEQFSQTLWREQKTNAAIRHYLKNHSITDL